MEQHLGRRAIGIELQEEYIKIGLLADPLFSKSDLIQYLNNKTRSASRGSKAGERLAAFTLFMVLVEDYVKHDYT